MTQKFYTIWQKSGSGFLAERTYTKFYAEQRAKELTLHHNKLFIAVPKKMTPEVFIFKKRPDLHKEINIVRR